MKPSCVPAACGCKHQRVRGLDQGLEAPPTTVFAAWLLDSGALVGAGLPSVAVGRRKPSSRLLVYQSGADALAG